MKSVVYAIVSTALVLSAVCDEAYDEEYSDVNCQYHWGGTICDCENLKYVIADSICCCSRSKVFH